MAKMMKAVVMHEPGGPEVLKIEQRPMPQALPGQILIRVEAFGLNRSELFTRQGHSHGVRFPRVLGIEAVGTVAQAPGREFRPGQTVATHARRLFAFNARAWDRLHGGGHGRRSMVIRRLRADGFNSHWSFTHHLLRRRGGLHGHAAAAASRRRRGTEVAYHRGKGLWHRPDHRSAPDYGGKLRGWKDCRAGALSSSHREHFAAIFSAP